MEYYKEERGQGDLATRSLILENKKFYLDVKENQRGRFIKIAEMSTEGRKNQIMMTVSAAAIFRKKLVHFIDFYHDLEKLDPENLTQGELKSEVMLRLQEDNKKYYMDLNENARGRFLKVSEITQDSNRGYSRFLVFIPADGMAEFEHNLGELIDEFGNGEFGNEESKPRGFGAREDAEDAFNAPENKHLKIENKNFYFDVKQNNQGRYMSISEVRGNFRDSLLVPESGWESFREALDDYVFSAGDAEETFSATQNKNLRIENKSIYFDIKKNQQGRYMSISEVKGKFRNNIRVPESGWDSFRDILEEQMIV